MDQQELLQKLQDLHTELESHPEMDQHARDALEQLACDINGLLDKSDPEKRELIGPVREKMSDMMATFEQGHPNLTRVLSQITDLLAHIGI